MSRCGCDSGSCACVVQGGDNATVTGAGTSSSPYVVSAVLPAPPAPPRPPSFCSVLFTCGDQGGGFGWEQRGFAPVVPDATSSPGWFSSAISLTSPLLPVAAGSHCFTGLAGQVANFTGRSLGLSVQLVVANAAGTQILWLNDTPLVATGLPVPDGSVSTWSSTSLSGFTASHIQGTDLQVDGSFPAFIKSTAGGVFAVSLLLQAESV